MIVRINGGPFMDWANEKADQFIQWEVESAAKGIYWMATTTLKTLAPMIPELAGIAICVFITIGMFTDFGKWAARSLLVFLGASVWVLLA